MSCEIQPAVFIMFALCLQSEESENDSDDPEGLSKRRRMTDETILRRQERRKWEENRSVNDDYFGTN